jgi:CHAT domain-containing protein
MTTTFFLIYLHPRMKCWRQIVPCAVAGNTLLLGAKATESAFKRFTLADYRVIHLAVHGFASTTDSNRAALVLLSDPTAGEDGLLQAAEIVQLKLNADLVILSACDTAVGPIQGEEGIETLSRPSSSLVAGP